MPDKSTTPDPVELTRTFYETMDSDWDFDALASSLAAGTFCGRGAVGKWFADWFRSFADGYRFEVDEIRSVAERVFVVVSHHGRGRTSGVELDWSVPYAYTVRSGKIVRVEIFERRAEALEAVGLEE